jgi:RNA polymerase sigma-70 factor (ECF subfamily)
MRISAVAERPEEAALSTGPTTSAGFSEVYGTHSRPLYATALRMLRRPEEAEDAVQETFLTLYRKAPELDDSRLGAWLHRVLANECIDRMRRGKRWRTTGVDEDLSPAPPPQDGPNLDLERAVSRLPERARLVFLLHDVEGFKHREMAGMLDLSEGTTKSQLFRARKMLREFMGQTPRGV